MLDVQIFFMVAAICFFASGCFILVADYMRKETHFHLELILTSLVFILLASITEYADIKYITSACAAAGFDVYVINADDVYCTRYGDEPAIELFRRAK